MYPVDDLDRVAKLQDVPQSDIGSPEPMVLGDEDSLLLCYLASEPEAAGDGASPTWPMILVYFGSVTVHLFGPPNDEAFEGHPLALRGLEPYGAFEVLDSSWIRQLERMNAVHPEHDRAHFLQNKRHFVFAFHDSTLECVAQGYSIERFTGSSETAFDRMRMRLFQR